MDQFAGMLFVWNEWIVLPLFTVVAFIYHIRRRKLSTFLIFLGLLMWLVGQVLMTLYSQSPLHHGHMAGLAIFSLGLLAFIVGGILYLRKDYVVPSKQA